MLIQPHSSTLHYILSLLECGYEWWQITSASWQQEREVDNEWRVYICNDEGYVKMFTPKPLSPFMLKVHTSLAKYFIEEKEPVYAGMDMQYTQKWMLYNEPRIVPAEYEITGATYTDWLNDEKSLSIRWTDGGAAFCVEDGQYRTSLDKEQS